MVCVLRAPAYLISAELWQALVIGYAGLTAEVQAEFILVMVLPQSKVITSAQIH